MPLKMTEALFGLVTQVDEPRRSGEGAKAKEYIDVFVCCGQRVVRTTGVDAGYRVGEYAVMSGVAKKGRFEWNADEIEFQRSGVLTIAEIAEYFPQLKQAKVA